MIFLDESGKRWKHIKRSTAAIGLLTALPVTILLVGSLIYQPDWGLLPLAKKASSLVLSVSTKAQPHSSPTTATKSAPKTNTNGTKVAGQVAYQAGGGNITSSPTSFPASSPPLATTLNATIAPSSTQTTQSTSASPTENNSAQKDYGQSHKPAK